MLAAATVLLATCPSALAVPEASALRLMPLGDSITQWQRGTLGNDEAVGRRLDHSEQSVYQHARVSESKCPPIRERISGARYGIAIRPGSVGGMQSAKMVPRPPMG